ncbi:MAG: glycoside hydrolase family 88 protein [Rikenellaceae bacterium]
MKNYITLALFPLLFAQCVSNDVSSSSALDYCAEQVTHSIESLQPLDPTMTPRNIAPGATSWNLVKVQKEEWCAGFWPGVLWYNYEYTQDEQDLRNAQIYTEGLYDIAMAPAYDHDLGFLIYCSYGNGYRLTKNEAYKDVILTSAENLSKLFNPNAGTILSWPREIDKFGGHNTIIDNMINLEMLFWAEENGGSKTLRDIAISHADRTMETLFRPDGTSYHVAVFNPVSGEHIRSCTHQGYADDTMWARGQTWGIYGFTMCYRFTQDPKYLAFAEKLAAVFLKDLPQDMVPYWDYNDPTIPNAYRDTSAAAVAASALLELSTYVPGKGYLETAKEILTSLDANYRNNDAPAFLLHSTGNYPAGSEIDYSIIYADYYYYEALLRLKRLEERKSL